MIWIDVTDASGNKFGSGPITTATGWTSTRLLDGVGTFSFSMPAADPVLECSDGTALLKNKRYVRCWRAGDDPTNPRDRLQEVGAGIIESVALRVGSPSMLEVSGVDLLSELANITVGDLHLYLDDVQTPRSVKTIPSVGDEIVWTPGDTVNLNPFPDNFLYVNSLEQFWRISFTVGSPQNTAVADLTAQYYSTGMDPDGWDYVVITDGTKLGGAPFRQSGNIDFDPSLGWASEPTSSGYDIRLFSETEVHEVQFTAITVTVRKPTLTALQDAMAMAPAGWTLDPAGKLETEAHLPVGERKGVYLQMAGESALATLLAIAEQTGEHFILSPVGRRVLWLGKDQTSSGLRAIGPVDPGATPDDFALYIQEGGLQRTVGSYELATRLYAFGGGVGDERITLADATDAAPAGYTLDGDGSWLQNDAAVAEYGRIDAPGEYTNIVALDTSTASAQYAGNTLLQRAYEDLRRLSQLQEAYQLSVIPARYSLWPGQTIRVVYHEWRDGFHAINIDTTLWVLAVDTAIEGTGIAVVGLTVATVDSFPVYDSTRIASAITTGSTSRSQKLPGNELTKSVIGEVTGVRIIKGKVVAVSSKPGADVIPDGRHAPEAPYTFAAIETKNGRITNIEYTS